MLAMPLFHRVLNSLFVFAGPPQVDGIESTVSSMAGSTTADDLRDGRGRHTHSKVSHNSVGLCFYSREQTKLTF